ncbi:gliding motility-associated C-terminal domain-containing protein [Lutibacter oricola]|uniref:Gliding motility-associated C-terminal domain-containing protein n=1 Tax=Lutibacter oricola TaxID=762486 RepID=A0A1H3CE16_9FLAO|nr:gliding motility-associated C-terminal domain-containing protein [Lutibacter oricola]SDX51749.1 gliding motility-associated C-terminal domain-containing protein [Lutibacter oricola]
MKIRIFLLFLICQTAFGQSAFFNNGNVQIHEGGSIGFHTDLINNGVFNKNLGLAGFYNKGNFLVVSGTNKSIFYNVEVDVEDNLYLETSLGITNNLSFFSGHIVTPRNSTNINLEFINYGVYAGEGDLTHVDGYTKIINEGEFVFPIGHNDVLRPMILPNQVKNTFYSGAYFNEDPNNPSTFSQSFDTTEKQFVLDKVSEVEFWDLDGDTETSIILTWNIDSNIEALAEDLEPLTVVGWSKDLKKWIDLGQENIEGDLEEGEIESKPFVPNDYEVITIGSDVFSVGSEYTENSENHNFGISPNGDGINDTFVIEGIELRPNNVLYIYNRWGALVYSKKSYDNTWGGFSEHDLTIKRSKGLPEGTYFYILKFMDENVNWQGWIYLRR